VMILTAEDLNPMLRDVDKMFARNMRRLFSTQGGSGGPEWQALSPRYKAWKDRAFPGRKILSLRGKLRRSLASRSSTDHVARWTLKPRARLIVGTSVRYAAYHAPGGLHNPKLPVRDPLQHTAPQSREYKDAVRRQLKRKLARLGRVLAARHSSAGFRGSRGQ